MTTSQDSSSAPSSPAPGGKHLAIFGATGGIGRELVKLALDAGHRVTALVRDPDRMDLTDPKLSLVEGDVRDEAAVARVVHGTDAVLCALGAPALSSSRVRSEGTEAIVRAMEGEGIDRLVFVSVFGAHESREALPFFLKYLLFPLYLRRAVADHERQEDILQGTDIGWTAVRPPFLTDGDHTGAYAHGFGGEIQGLTLDVSRADVADFMLRQLDTDRYLRRSAAISYQKAS